ncbi:MAG TPA: hypothetical protein VN577_11180 [Terriglobales bacterium]|nr:hypothetical protein [Terriglobales bacterium]
MTSNVSQEILALSEYFASIKDEFKSTYDAQLRPNPFSRILIFFDFCLVFSIIPISPIPVWWLCSKRLLSLTIAGWTLPVRSFFFWWVTFVVLAGVGVFVLSKLSNSRRPSEDDLSLPQMRFALSFACADELSDYQKNRRESHVQRALKYERRLYNVWPHLFHPERHDEAALDSVLEYSAQRFPSLFLASYRRFAWFRLDPDTEKIMTALAEFHSKTRDRIADKKDLGTVVEAFQNLALYFFSEIPEKQDNDPNLPNNSAAIGKSALLKLSHTLELLPPYSRELLPATAKEKITSKVTARLAAFTGVFAHSNLFVCYLVWVIFLSFLVIGAVLLGRHYFPTVEMDSTLLSLVIGTPMLGAGGMAVLSRQKRLSSTSGLHWNDDARVHLSGKIERSGQKNS